MDFDMEYENEELEGFVAIQQHVQKIFVVIGIVFAVVSVAIERYYERYNDIVRGPNRLQQQIDSINRLVRQSDRTCVEQLRVDRKTFMRLCNLIQMKGVSHSKHVLLEEKVAMFLKVLGHHKKIEMSNTNFLG